MELRNIEKAKELIPQLEMLEMAKRTLADSDAEIVIDGRQRVVLPSTMRYNVLNVINCEYERVRKEVSEL